MHRIGVMVSERLFWLTAKQEILKLHSNEDKLGIQK